MDEFADEFARMGLRLREEPDVDQTVERIIGYATTAVGCAHASVMLVRGGNEIERTVASAEIAAEADRLQLVTPLVRRLTRQPWTTSFPSGHAASAAAFTCGVALELPVAGTVLAPVAAAVGYSRVHVGVHHVSDVLAGAVLGAEVALALRRWWPVQSPAPAMSSATGSAMSRLLS